MSKISACIWMNEAGTQEAPAFYTGIFPNSEITATTRYTEVGQNIHGHSPGEVMTIEYEIDGFSFCALNGGDDFKPNPSISFFVRCNDAAEVDRLWAALQPGGTALMPLDSYPFNERYGWIRDRFGVSYQLIVSPYSDGQRISPCLLFTGDVCGKAEEAMNLYTGIFPDSRIGDVARYESGQEPDVEGTVMHGEFQIAGQPFVAMDSAQDHRFSFTEGVSLIVDTEDQHQIDRYWNALSAVPDSEICGWLKDRFGVSWQIVPNSQMNQVLTGTDEHAKQHLFERLFEMSKITMSDLLP